MSDASPSDDARLCQRDTSQARDGDDNVSLVLRPAEFDDEPRDAPVPETEVSDTRHSHSRSHSAAGPARASTKRRELVELAGNPFVDPHTVHADGRPAFRQDIYPAYDANGRRIGLDHVRNSISASEANGYYRKHVHEYDDARGAPLPLPSQVSVQSDHPEQGPLPPVSAVIAGISPDSQYGVGSFSHIQNRPRSPHEILGLPLGAPLNLWSLLDPQSPEAKPQYNYHVLVKLAILGNKGQKATLQEILRAIRLRFPYYAKLPKNEATAFGNSIRHLLSLLAAFVREPKPVTEPGKGAYWRVDFSKGEGNKRVRKRNKPQKKTADGQFSDKQTQDDADAPFEGSQSPASPQSSSKSPMSESPIETQPHKLRNKGGRKPAPKNLITTPDGGTATVPISSTDVSQDEFYTRLDPALMNSRPSGPNSQPRMTSQSQPLLQLHPTSGALRERVIRGAARNAPYPPSKPTEVSASGSRSSSPEHDRHYSSASPVETPYRNGQHLKESPISESVSPQPNHQGLFGSNAYQGYEYNAHRNTAYMQHRSVNNGSHFGSVSPADSPISAHPGLSPYSEQSARLPTGSMHYPNDFSHSTGSFEILPTSSGSYGLTPLTTSSSAGSAPGPSSAVSQSSSFAFAQYAEHRHMHEPDVVSNTACKQQVVPRHDDGGRDDPTTWNPAHSARDPVESPTSHY